MVLCMEFHLDDEVVEPDAPAPLLLILAVGGFLGSWVVVLLVAAPGAAGVPGVSTCGPSAGSGRSVRAGARVAWNRLPPQAPQPCSGRCSRSRRAERASRVGTLDQLVRIVPVVAGVEGPRPGRRRRGSG
jgi:hypothetical protein